MDLAHTVTEKVKRVYAAARLSRLIIYANPDDSLRAKVLRKVCELANLLGARCVYLNTIDLIKAASEDYDKIIEAALEELLNLDAHLVIIDNFEVLILIENIREKFIDMLRRVLSRGTRIILGALPEVLGDSRVSVIRDQLGSLVMLDLEEPVTKKVQREFVTLFKKFIAKVSGVDDGENIYVA